MARTSDNDLRYGFGTRAVHAGQSPDPTTGAIMPPIYQTSTYVQDGLGRHKGFEYARTRNPTRDALERNLAALEGGRYGLAWASGLAATDAVLKLLNAGDHVICGENLYGGTHRLMVQVFQRLGVTFTFVDTRDVHRIAEGVTPATRMVYVETPTNPMMRLTDLAAVGQVARARDLLFVVDNTFATPYFQTPLEFGADIVLHSTTKYLNGHSDMVGGALITSRDDLAERLAFLQNAAGAVPGPMDCWLALRGTKTLALRMRQHDASGRRIAAWLADRPEIEAVYYPGLPSHPQYDLACRQMRGFGGMISLELGSIERARRFVEAVRLFALAESLGGVESLIGHPASMTHASVPAAMRQAMGLTDGLVRLSIGIEDPDDLLADIEAALGSLGPAVKPAERPAVRSGRAARL
jgi:cystathionine beta-lyase/cystathionine gamma-synthase